MKVSVAEAKAKLSELLCRVEAGEAVTITRRGQPMAVLQSPKQPLPARAAWRAEQRPPTRSVLEDLLTIRDEQRH